MTFIGVIKSNGEKERDLAPTGILGGTGALPVILGRLASRPYSLSHQSTSGSDPHPHGTKLSRITVASRVPHRPAWRKCCKIRDEVQIVPRLGLVRVSLPSPPTLSRRERGQAQCGCALPSPFGRGVKGEGIRATMLVVPRILQQFPEAGRYQLMVGPRACPGLCPASLPGRWDLRDLLANRHESSIAQEFVIKPERKPVHP